MDAQISRRGRLVTVALGGLVCAGLLGGVVSPVWAASDPGDDGGSWPAGGFALGDDVEGLIDERSGALSFVLPAGPLGLSWDARAAAVDRHGFGDGWTVAGAGFVDTEGGVRVFPASGGVFPAVSSVPSGLSGYALEDLRFEQVPGVVPARADGLAGERAYAFRLIELGGTVSYFDAAGDPVVRMDPFGNRADWSWADGGSHQLTEMVSDVGVVTSLDWSDPARVQVSTRAGAGPASVTTVELDGGRVAAVVDAGGGRTRVAYTAAGLVSRLEGVSGASTEVAWQQLPDASVAVDRVRVVDPGTGAVLSERAWEPAVGLASGWPAVQDASMGASAVGAVASAGLGAYSTSVSDGLTRIVSEYSERQVLTGRKVIAGGTSGERVLQEQVFEYPGDEGGGLPPQADRPSRVAVTHWNEAGVSRTAEEGFVVDELGRVVEQTAADGTVTETHYDLEPGEHGVPVGLPLTERVTTSDGLVSESRYTLNDEGTAVVAAETWTGTGDDLSRVARAEYEVADDGFVTEERVFPQGGAGDPVVTAFDKAVDLASGELTVSETVAAGSQLATTTTTVSDLLYEQPRTVTDMLGNTTTTDYDERGRPTRVEDAAGRAETTEYRTRQQHGENATVVESPGGVVTTTETDALGRVVRITDNVDHGTATPGHVRVVETREYPEPGVVEITDAWGAVTRSEQDGLGRTLKTTAASGLSEVSTYDDATQERTTGVTPTGDLADAEIVATAQTDETERVRTSTGSRRDGVPVPPSATRWDGFGRETSATGAGQATRTDFDRFGNPATSTTRPETDTETETGAETEPAPEGAAPADARIASREFDAFGVSVHKTLTDATGSRTAGTRELDRLGRTKTETDPAGVTTRYEYTPDGLIAQTSTSAGQTTVQTYDQTTRRPVEVVTTSPVGEPVRAAFTYDPVTGALLTVSDPADEDATIMRYESDDWGNTTSVTYPDGSQVRYGYDEHGRKAWVDDVAGMRTHFAYTAAGELARVTQADAAGKEIASVDYTYDEHRRLQTLTRGNGTATTYTYTAASEIASEVTTGPGGTVDTRREYTYSPTGTVTTRTDTTRNAETGADEATTTSYRYDAFDRLVGSTVHDGPTTDAPARQQVEYTLNVSGDVTRESTATPGAAGAADEEVTVREYAYTPAGQLTALTTTHPDGSVTVAPQEYDAAGNLVRGHDGTTYAYDAQNRLAAETTAAGELIRSGYWVTGQRRDLTTTDPVTGAERQTRFYWDGASLLADTHTTDTATDAATADAAAADAAAADLAATGRAAGSYLVGATRHARTTSGHGEIQASYYTHDRHGNVTELTDGTGAVNARYGYDDYGASVRQPADAEASAASLVGDVTHQPFGYAGEYTNPTGTQHLQVRSYDPETRRFQQFDLADEHNPYWFGNANPITHLDPTGRSGIPDWGLYLLTGVGLALAAFGLFAAAGAASAALAGAGSWAAVLTGTKVTLGVTIAAAAVDVGLATAIAVDDFKIDIFDDEVALILGITTAVLGLGAGAAAIGNRLAPARTLAEVMQKDWSVAKRTGAKLLYNKKGVGRHWKGISNSTPHRPNWVAFQVVKRKADDTAIEAAKVMPPNGKALSVIARTDGSLSEMEFSLENPRYRRGNGEDKWLTKMIPLSELESFMTEHDIHVLRVKFSSNHTLEAYGVEGRASEVWVRNPSEAVQAASVWKMPATSPKKYDD